MRDEVGRVRIIAFDPGTYHLAYVLYDSQERRVEASGVRHLSKNDGAIQRLRYVRDEVGIALPAKADIDVVAVERMFSNNNRSDFLLHVVSFFVQERAFELGVLCVEVSTATAKKAATGRGNAKKPEVQAVLNAEFGMNLCEDRADALAVCLAVAEMQREGRLRG